MLAKFRNTMREIASSIELKMYYSKIRTDKQFARQEYKRIHNLKVKQIRSDFE